MEEQKKICQNCREEFVIDKQDFAFYEKMEVPAPTWCPDCRLQRRMVFRNERKFYKTKCGLCNKNILSLYSPHKFSKIFCYDCWWSDKWDAEVHNKEYDFSRPFFEQFKELFEVVPGINMWSFGNKNCEYGALSAFSKNVYYSASIVSSENIFYSCYIDNSKDTFDSFVGDKLESCYENINSERCFNSSFLVDSHNCLDSQFLYNCNDCQNCFLSSNLRHKKFYIKNKPYSEKEYFEKIEEFNFGSFSSFTQSKQDFKNIQDKTIRRFADIINSPNSTGDNIRNCRNAKNCFAVSNAENIKYCWRIVNESKDCLDVSGTLKSELCYEGMLAGSNNQNVKFYMKNRFSKNLDYCVHCISSSNLFGCVGLRNKEYCILNKQYTKEEYQEMVPKIIEQMNKLPYTDKKGRTYSYGEFFPPELSPFSYNETVAQEYFPLTKDTPGKTLKRGIYR